MTWLRPGTGLSVLLWTAVAGAQPAASEQASEWKTPREGEAEHSTDPAEQEATKHAMKLAQILNPRDYGPAFNIGAQAELVVPAIGSSALLLGYEAVWMHAELSVGFGIGDDVENDQDTTDFYLASLRLAFPVHRGVRADFSVLFGGGVTVIDQPEDSAAAIGSLGVGAKFRTFVSPNLALAATLGLVTNFRDEERWSVLAGARPLGAASVVYFFR